TAAAIGVGAIGLFALNAPQAKAEIQKHNFEIVGTWGFLENYKKFEKKFWTEQLPAASGGKLTANAKPYTELGLKGYEVMSGLKKGAYDAVHALTSYSAKASPALEGIDLAGVIQDYDVYRKAVNAYRPVIAREIAEKYNAKLINMYTFPSQQLWCNLKDKSIKNVSLKDLAGKKIRTYSRTLGDFISGLNASAVTIAFAEVVPALQKGVADCGITGTMPAYNAKWWQVVTHNIRVRVGYAATFTAMNMDTWKGLNGDTQKLIMSEGKKMENDIWIFEGNLDQEGMDCNASGPCPKGKPGGMIPITPSDEDKAMIKDISKNVVLKRWAARCGTACVTEWNNTIGKVVGVTASE
ncbi:TRAP transporter substrate-binding protein, partial [Alphaproteobacteria bacterium]|nr:TRAP transporter substrate-binding protein [Alphaproteobacteria bacterium]